jgi:ABC-type Fe3+/spermidine/putrescine transport system ATPase subunit
MSMSDRVVVMRLGEIEQVGSPVELYREPASLFVASFVGSSNVIPVKAMRMDDGAIAVDLGGTVVRANASEGVRPGSEAALVLRAESISLEPANGQVRTGGRERAFLRGRVADVRFVGAMVHYRVDVDGTRLHAIESSEGSLLQEGSDVDVSWRTEEALVLPGTPDVPAPSQDEGSDA